MSNVEIERKFLVCGEFRHLASSSSRIKQGYICSERGRTVRVRVRDDKAYLTIKGPSNGISRFEWEREITLEDAKALLELCRGGYIDKTRYLVPQGKHIFEVDEFYGDNEGLVFAELELKSEDEEFERPDWLGAEVSGDRHYYNSQLLLDPYKNWREDK